MGKKKGGKTGGGGEEKNSGGGGGDEGQNLLGSPTFEELGNGRYRCIETGHELPVHARESYAQTKHCRLGLIDAALAHHKPPLNMFRQDPTSSSKLICKLTGDIINKNEEHIWKHINGKRFLNMLERTELEQVTPKDLDGKKKEKKVEKKLKVKPESSDKKKKKQKKEENGEKSMTDVNDSSGKESEAEEELDFWMPPVGERWDNDDGGGRWGSDSESGLEDDDADNEDGEHIVGDHDHEELTKSTKRMSLEIGPSSFASRKKKKKTSAA